MRNLKGTTTFPPTSGFKGPRAPLDAPPDIRTSERHSPLRRTYEGSRHRGPDFAGAARGRIESRRPTTSHSAWRPDDPCSPGPPPTHAASGRLGSPPAPHLLQFPAPGADAHIATGRGGRPRG